MNDGYRYFVSYATGDDGLPITTNDPSYFRCPENFFGRVQYWSVDTWENALLTGLGAYLSDLFGSGATVREILDDKEIPHA